MDDLLGENEKGVSKMKTILQSLTRKAVRGNMKATETLLERAYGRPRQQVDLAIDLAAELKSNDHLIAEVFNMFDKMPQERQLRIIKLQADLNDGH
jgi:hypothetical protein